MKPYMMVALAYALLTSLTVAQEPHPIVLPPDGGTVYLKPGVYIGPDNIPTSTRIIGEGALIGDELLNNGGAVIQQVGSVKTVRILYNHPLVIDRAAAIEMRGVILDFQGSGGLTLDSVSESRFAIGIQNTGDSPALQMLANHGNNAGNVFEQLIIWNCNGGIFLKGWWQTGAITWNDFDHLQILHCSNYGVDISMFADTNFFRSVRVSSFDRHGLIAGAIFNEQAIQQDYDVGGNTFDELMVDSADRETTCGALFRGYTLGNYVRLTYGLIDNQHKVCIQPGFHTDTIEMLHEQPRGPQNPGSPGPGPDRRHFPGSAGPESE